MTDTAQPGMAAENVALDDAAHAFKVHLGQTDERPRDERGRFAPSQEEEQAEAEEINTEAAPVEGGEAVENGDGLEEAGEAAEEAQLDPVELPPSWSKDDAELWASLPADVQTKVSEREAQREAAVNAKFQEAANVRKANEALFAEAQSSRDHAIGVIDQVKSLIAPQRPPTSMLISGSDDYNPEGYHYLLAQYETAQELVQVLDQQQKQLSAQQEAEATNAQRAAIEEIERTARPAFLADVPELTDPAKAPAVMHELIQYAMEKGIPAENFSPQNAGNITSAELHILWEATQYRKLKAAQAKVKDSPKPEPRKPQPVVKPGVATPRAAVEQARMKGAMERLSKTGSVEDGAAIFKTLLKGMK